jgi:hypothetical protein
MTRSDVGVDVDVSASLVQRSANQIACDMGGEVVILDLQSGTYYGLDLLGAQIWNLIEQPVPVAVICAAIMAKYDVDAQTCERDVVTFVQKIAAAGLVEITNAPPR